MFAAALAMQEIGRRNGDVARVSMAPGV